MTMFRKLSSSATELKVQIYLDGIPLKVSPKDTVAAVLVTQSEGWSRLSPVSHMPRAPYCLMGVCFECLVTIDGVHSQQACQVYVRSDMRIERPLGKREIVK